MSAIGRFFEPVRQFVAPTPQGGWRRPVNAVGRALSDSRLTRRSDVMVTSGAGALAGGAGSWFGLSWAERRFPKVMKKILGKRGSTRATLTKSTVSAGGAFAGSGLAHKLVQLIRSR
jgi:hypothetical protein